MQIEALIDNAISAATKAGKAILEIYNSQTYTVEQKLDRSPLTQADLIANEIITNKLKSTGIPILSEESESIPFKVRQNWEFFWMVDPLDGTKEFIKRNGEFAVNIALIQKENPVAGIIYIPISGELFVAIDSQGAFKSATTNETITFSEIKTKGIRLPISSTNKTYRIITSNTHRNAETDQFIAKIQETQKDCKIVYCGSSIKFCKLAEGIVDIYPRFAPTMEWDTAAGHAILKACRKNIFTIDRSSELRYNKPDLKNPFFIAE